MAVAFATIKMWRRATTARIARSIASLAAAITQTLTGNLIAFAIKLAACHTG